jgi:hypothetical protein
MLDKTEFEPFRMPKQRMRDFFMGSTPRHSHTRKQAVIEGTLQHLNSAVLQIIQIISERFAIRIARATINRLRHPAHFKFSLQKRY